MDYNYNGYDRGYTEPAMTSADYMNRTYRWMAVGLLITFAAAFVTAATPLLYVVNSLYLVFTIAELVLVYVLSARVQSMSVGGARATFFAYALLNGMVLSYYFLVFDLGTLVLAFLATSLYFGLMAVYGTTTHKMHLPSVAFCVDTQSEAEDILKDITKQKKALPFRESPCRSKISCGGGCSCPADAQHTGRC